MPVVVTEEMVRVFEIVTSLNDLWGPVSDRMADVWFS
jgi:hypothetical protein